MSEPITLLLPWFQSRNKTEGRNAGPWTRKAKKDYQNNAALHILSQLRTITGNNEWLTITGSVELKAILFPPDRRRRDLDNFYPKALQDEVVNSGIIQDDSQIDRLILERGEPVEGGKIVVIITPLPGWNPQRISNYWN